MHVRMISIIKGFLTVTYVCEENSSKHHNKAMLY